MSTPEMNQGPHNPGPPPTGPYSAYPIGGPKTSRAAGLGIAFITVGALQLILLLVNIARTAAIIGSMGHGMGIGALLMGVGFSWLISVAAGVLLVVAGIRLVRKPSW